MKYSKNFRLNHFLLLCACSIGFSSSIKAQIEFTDSISKIEYLPYFTQESWKSTGSVSILEGSKIENHLTSNIMNALYGRIPGLSVLQGNEEPGNDSPIIFSRGRSTFGPNNTPLIIIDGVEAPLELLNPSEIESIALFKDAMATILYGSKGANGVLYVNTKRGDPGDLKVNFQAQYGLQSPVRPPEFLNSSDYATLYNEANINDGGIAVYTSDDINYYRNGSDPYFHPNVDWFNEVIKERSPISKYNIDFSGGDNFVKYFASIGYLNNHGIYKNFGDLSENSTNSRYTRYNLRSNIAVNFTENISASLRIGGAIDKKSNPGSDYSENMFNLLELIPPNVFPVYTPNGLYGGSQLYSNPYGDLMETGSYIHNGRFVQTVFSLRAKLDKFVKGLSVTGSASYNNYFLGFSNKSRTYARYSIAKAGSNEIEYNQIGINTSLSSSEGSLEQWQNIVARGIIDYSRKFGKHEINGTFMSGIYTKLISGTDLPFTHINFAGRVNYVFSKKYIGEIGYSYMGSDNFQEGHRFGLFPAASLGWIISNEKFMQVQNLISLLKIRASYGITGNDQIGGTRFGYSNFYDNSAGYYFDDSNTRLPGMENTYVGNPNLTWEKSEIMNVGFEFEIKEQFGFMLDVFNDDRSQILTTPLNVIPEYAGMFYPDLNIGKVNNKGFEVTVNFTSDRNKDFGIFIQSSVWYAKNQILEYGEEAKPYDYLKITGHQIGQPILLEAIGFFSDYSDIENSPHQVFTEVIPGDIKYKDQNNDNIIDLNDRIPSGETRLPKLTASSYLSFNYKGIDLSILIQGVTGRDIYLNNEYYRAFQNNGKVSPVAYGRWTETTKESATYPRLSAENNMNNYQYSTFWQEDGSFIKLRHAEIGYTFSEGVVQRIKIKHLRIYLAGTNLFSLDHLKDLDPEVLSGYPAMKNYSLGLKMQF